MSEPTIHDEWAEIDASVRDAVDRALQTRTDTQFDEDAVAVLEAALTRRLGYPHVMLASSATAAAHVVFLRCRLRGATTAALPAHVFPGIAGTAVAAGLATRFLSVDRDLILVPSTDPGRDGIDVVHFPWGDVDRPASLLPSLQDRTVLLDVSHATPRIPRSIWTRHTCERLYAVGSLGAGKFLSGMEMGFVAASDGESLREVAALGAVRRTDRFGVAPPTAAKLRPHPLSLAVLAAQLERLDEKLAAHDQTWNHLVPDIDDLGGVRVVTTTPTTKRIFWRCVLEVDGLDGTDEHVGRLCAAVRARGLAATRPEYLDDAMTQLPALDPSLETSARPAGPPRRYIALPGFVRLGPSGRGALLGALRDGLDDLGLRRPGAAR